MQLAYTRNLVPGIPGTPFGLYNELTIVSYPAGVAGILPGTAVEVSSTGLLFPLKDAGTAGSFVPALVGVALNDPMMENSYPPGSGTSVVTFGGYALGQMVPVVRKGRVFVIFDGTGSWPQMGSVNVWHSSTGANLQGVFTLHATQTTAGAEIDTLVSGVVGIRPELSGTFTDGFGQSIITGIVELNLPGVSL